jgi:hypothetical protein
MDMDPAEMNIDPDNPDQLIVKNIVSLSVYHRNGDVIQRAWLISDDSVEGMLHVLGTPYMETLTPASVVANIHNFVGTDGDTSVRTYPRDEE